MSRKKRIRFARSAIDDLQGIQGYYIEHNVPEVGERLFSAVLADIELLEMQPEMGRMVPEFASETLRELIRPPFRIVYRIQENTIYIVRVWRSERLLELP